ncbi:MAG: DMT family transporter, partial [Bacteroidota bacterium]
MVKLLVQQGGKNGLQYPRSISFCNVLFVGNLCAGLLVVAMFDTKKILLELKESTRRKKMMLLSSSLTAIIYPALIFTALEFTSVTNVVLLSRFEVIIFILLSIFLYKIRLNIYQHIGYVMIGAAVIGLTLVNDNFMFSRGDVLILIATVFFAVNSILSKELLKLTSLPTFLFTRNFCSALVFLAIGIYLYGWHHFQHAFRGNLWSIMLFYALIIIVLGQYLWFRYKTEVNFSATAWLLIINPF